MQLLLLRYLSHAVATHLSCGIFKNLYSVLFQAALFKEEMWMNEIWSIHLPPNNKGDVCFYYFYSYLQNTLVVISHYLARWIYYSIAAIPSYNITIIPRTFNVLTDICMFYAQSRMSLRMLYGSMSASVTNLSTCLQYSTLPLNAH